MFKTIIVGVNLIVGGVLVVGILLMSLRRKSPCAIIYFSGMTLGVFLMLRIIWLGIIPNFQLLLLVSILFWLLIAWLLMLVNYLICGNEL